MKKVYWHFGIALLSVSLVLAACDTGGGVSPYFQAVRDAADLLAELEALAVSSVGVAATRNGATVTLTATTGTATVTLTDDLPIQAGVTLAVGANVTLEVPAANALTVDGTLDVKGRLDVKGTLDVEANANVVVTGVFFLDGSDATKTNNGELTGTITIESGGKSYSTGTFTGGGYTVIKAGGEAYAGQTPGPGPALAAVGGEDAILNLTSGSFALNAGGYVLTGNATVTKTFGVDGIPLVIAANSTFTVDIKGRGSEPGNNWPGFWLMRGGKITGTDNTSGIEIRTPSGVSTDVVPAGTGLIYVSQNNTTGANFYENNNAAIGEVASSNVDVPVGDYTWDSSLNSNAGGWKKSQ